VELLKKLLRDKLLRDEMQNTDSIRQFSRRVKRLPSTAQF
jgi:hypothetical protein